MENDKLYRKIISVLAIPISPIVSFLFSLKYFSSIYGGIFFILFGVFLNTSLAFHQREDITRMVDIYKQLSFYGVSVYRTNDIYFTSICSLLAQFNVSLYGALCLWSVIYYIGFWLVMRELVKGYYKSIMSILLVLVGFFAIDPGWFSVLRWSTAAFWAIYFFILAKDEKWISWKNYLPLLCLAIHFSFILPIIFFYASKLNILNLKGWMRIAVFTTPLPIFINGIVFQHILQAIIPSEVYASFGFYASASRIQQIEAAYHYGKFLYLPLFLMFIYMLYLQYKALDDEVNDTFIDCNLLKMALVFLTAYNFSFFSWDLLIRFRTFTLLIMTISVARYYYIYVDPRINRLIVPLLFAFLFYNYEFIINTLHTRFVINDLFSFPFDAIEHCKERLSNIRSIYL